MAQDTLLGFPAHTLPYRRGEFTTLSTASVPAYYVRRDFPIWQCFSLRQFSLTGVELVVAAVLGQQILVVTPLDDAALLQNHNGLGVADGGEPRPGWRERTASSATCLTVIKRSSPVRAAASARASGSF